MNEKMKEIEECLVKIVYGTKEYGKGKYLFKETPAWLSYYTLISNAKEWIDYLLSLLKEKNERIEELQKNRQLVIHELNNQTTERDKKIKELEEGIEKLKSKLKGIPYGKWETEIFEELYKLIQPSA